MCFHVLVVSLSLSLSSIQSVSLMWMCLNDVGHTSARKHLGLDSRANCLDQAPRAAGDPHERTRQIRHSIAHIHTIVLLQVYGFQNVCSLQKHANQSKKVSVQSVEGILSTLEVSASFVVQGGLMP